MFEAPSYNNFWDILMTSFQWPNLQTPKKKQNKLFFKFSPGYLLIFFYQLTKLEATCCKSFLDILTTSFQCQNLQRAITRKKKILFLKFSPGYLLIIFYQLTNFEASCCNSFKDILITSFQRAITQKKKKINFHQIIYSLWLSTHYPLLPDQVWSS